MSQDPYQTWGDWPDYDCCAHKGPLSGRAENSYKAGTGPQIHHIQGWPGWWQVSLPPTHPENSDLELLFMLHTYSAQGLLLVLLGNHKQDGESHMGWLCARQDP